jgi:hypothetical protein
VRTLSADHAARLAAGHFRVRVRVKDSLGTFRDLNTVAGFNAVKSVRWGEDVDSPGMTADVELYRNSDAISFSPLHDTSPLNRQTPFDAATSVAALIDLNRELRIEWALEADALVTPTWNLAFAGLVESFSLGSGETMAIGARGQYAELQDRLFEEEFVFAIAVGLETGPFRVWQPNTLYALNDRVLPTNTKANGRHYRTTTAGTSGATEPTWPASGTVASGGAIYTFIGSTSTLAGYSVQNVLTQMAQAVVPAGAAVFGDLGTTFTTYTPVSPGWNINVFQVKRENVWNALTTLAQQIGWDFRWKWSNGDSAFRPTLYDPNRAKVTPDRVFTIAEVRGYADVALDIANIRNAVRVVYSDTGDLDPQNRPKRKSVTAVDTTSVTRFGRRYMEVAEGSSSSIDSPGEATTMASAMLSDLASPVADVGVELRFFPWVELTDLLGLPADGRRFTSQQNLAVTSYSHEWGEGGRCSTTVKVRGKPASGWYRWARISGPANPDDVHRLTDGSGTAGSFVMTTTGVLRGQTLQVQESPIIMALPAEIELHVSASPGFTPSAATLRAAGRQTSAVVQGLKPGNTYYAKGVTQRFNDQRVVRSEPSEEVSFVAGYVEPCDLNPETVSQSLPANGSFEGWFLGDTVPPDHWEADTGAWSDWIRSTTAGDGAFSIGPRNTGPVRAELRSVWFPCAAGKAYVLDALLQRVAADGDVRLTIEWGDSAKASLGTATLITSTTGMTNFTRSRPLVSESPAGTRFARVKVGRDTSGTYQFRADAVSFRLAGEALVPVTYEANWVDYGGGYTGVAYWRDALGLIHIRGLAQTTVVRAIGALVFTLPLGFRPAAREAFSMQGGTVGNFVRVDVAANGQVLVMTALAVNDYLSFAGIIFDPR